MGHTPHQRAARAARSAGRLGARGATHPSRGGADRGAPAAARPPRGARSSLRARGAQPAVAVGHLHVPAQTPRAALPRGVHGRPLALHRRLRARAPPARRAGARGAAARHRRVRHAARDPDRPGPSVHGVARRDELRGGASARGHPPHQEPAAAPADARQDRALLEDAVGRVSLEDGVRGLRGLRAPSRALRAGVRLPAPAPGALGARARRSVLPRRAARARGDREERRGQRAAARARAAAAQAVLPGGPARRPRPVDRGERQRARGEGRRRSAREDRATARGGRR